ncbi:nucleotidyl transferase AbiEii/AbiGii toxin family protein [Subtercola boreus]|uniref:nucleotidyl transferase AbiEii/AbiGii toxin family protein n=1 Tax=Subtercola boreus TaxID=120213 RepID=UPI00209BF4CF|nr:nucleotidyl transferase AbiEii/AbiGii toxin family protein [Subtercola boreus]
MSELQADYGDGSAVRAAIKSAAQIAAREPNPSVDSLIRQATYDRFLCRIFSIETSPFILKGGTGMLARIKDARSTRDIDLAISQYETNAAIAELVELAGIDLGDHFRFVLTNSTEQIGGENQPYTEGVNLTFDVFIGVNRRGSISIDLATGHTPTGPIEKRTPSNRLHLPRLRTYDYMLYPIADQIADKVCATLDTYGSGNKSSSREKDLVDLITIALHEDVDAHDLRVALTTEMILRGLGSTAEFQIPASWGAGYAKLAKPINFLSDYPTVAEALPVAKALIDPVLGGSVETGAWDPKAMKWV